MAPRRKWMHLNIFQHYFEAIKAGSVEQAVDKMWNNILPRYFDPEEDYGMELEQRPLGTAKQRADLTIRYVHNGERKKVILIENKRYDYATQAGAWEEAVDQLTRYLKPVRTDQREVKDTLFGIVTIGRWSRFYELPQGDGTLKDYPGTGGIYYDFKDNENEMDDLLYQLYEKTRAH
ncbi:MAG: hypothetical protein Q9217_000413 [Psora testacea]